MRHVDTTLRYALHVTLAGTLVLGVSPLPALAEESITTDSVSELTAPVPPKDSASSTPGAESANEPLSAPATTENAAFAPLSAESSSEPMSTPESSATEPAESNTIYLDATSGNDANDGTSADTAVATFAKALTLMPTGGTIKVLAFDTSSNITMNKAGTLVIATDITLNSPAANAKGIILGKDATLNVEPGKTLTLAGYETGIVIQKGATLTDGHYVMNGGTYGFYAQGGRVVGTDADRSKLTIEVNTPDGRGFLYNGHANGEPEQFVNADITIIANASKADSGVWGGYGSPLTLNNTRMVTEGIRFHLQSANAEYDLKMLNSELSTKGKFYLSWSSGYAGFQISTNSPILLDNSKLTVDGGRFNIASSNSNIINSTVTIKNSNAGLNVRDNAGIHFINSDFVTENLTGPAFGVRTPDGGTPGLYFEENARFETPATSTRNDNGGRDNLNSTYAVTGGSFLIAYDPTETATNRIPTNGPENGNEFLKYLTLDEHAPSALTLNNADDSGTYTYKVARASSDGKRHVWVPGANITVKLNNPDATFADKTSADKTMTVARGELAAIIEDAPEFGINASLTAPSGKAAPIDKNGIAFLGWFYKDAEGAEQPFDWDTTHITQKDLEIYAKWDGKTVTYHNNTTNDVTFTDTASKDAASTPALDITTATRNNPAFAVPGKDFIGWSLTPDGSTGLIQPGELVTFPEGEQNADLYAQYKDQHYSIRFSANGGAFAADSVFRQHPETFDITTDENGGEVAIVKSQADYNEQLSEVLNKTLVTESEETTETSSQTFDMDSLTPNAQIATKLGYVVKYNKSWFGNYYYWYSDATAGDQLDFGSSSYDDNPNIIEDTTYYIQWQNDPNVEQVTGADELAADMWGNDIQGSNPTSHVFSGTEGISITGAVDVSGIKNQMQAIEDKYPGANLEDISLSSMSSTFSATIHLPAELDLSQATLTKDTVRVTGLGNCFDLSDVETNDHEITVTFTLKPGIKTYADLKAAVFSTGNGTSSTLMRRMGTPRRLTRALNTPANATGITDPITITIDGLAFPETTPGGTYEATGEVTGMFDAIATHEGSTKHFAFSWSGHQTDAGAPADGSDPNNASLAYRWNVTSPLQLELPGDLRIGENTEASAVDGHVTGTDFNMSGVLDVTSIKDEITSLKNEYEVDGSDASTITTSEVASAFSATLIFPEGIEVPGDISATLDDTNLFSITDTNWDNATRTLTVQMKLNKDYTRFIDLYNDVTATPDLLTVTTSELHLAETLNQGELITTRGTVTGTFKGRATSGAGHERLFNYSWHGVQIPEGRDAYTPTGNANDITYTIEAIKPEPITVSMVMDADLLLGKDTQHTSIPMVKPGDALPLVGQISTKAVKDKINALAADFTGNPDDITLSNTTSTFVAKLTVPEGVDLPATFDKTKLAFTDNDLFELSDVNTQGRTIVATMTLKDTYTTFTELQKAVNAVPDTLTLTTSDLTVATSVKNGDILRFTGKMTGTFEARARYQNIARDYHFTWTGDQIDSGTDMRYIDTDNETLSLSVQAKVAPKPSENPGGGTPGGKTPGGGTSSSEKPNSHTESGGDTGSGGKTNTHTNTDNQNNQQKEQQDFTPDKPPAEQIPNAGDTMPVMPLVGISLAGFIAAVRARFARRKDA